MSSVLATVLVLIAGALQAGDHVRQLQVDGIPRRYLVHIPPQYPPDHAWPVVLVFHGAATNSVLMAVLTGLDRKADDAGFIAVYPDGTGIGPLLFFEAGGRTGPLANNKVNDVKFVAQLLDDLETVVPVDKRRIYATGLSNGGMMCYRLAAEMSERIAAIAPVAGTMAIQEARPKRPVSVMHFHGMADKVVPPQGSDAGDRNLIRFKSVAETIAIWCRIDGCSLTPTVTDEPDRADDGTTVRRKTYGPGTDGAEVVLFEIEGGGHTWPGRESWLKFLGKSTHDISANDEMWEFFQRHSLPEKTPR